MTAMTLMHSYRLYIVLTEHAARLPCASCIQMYSGRWPQYSYLQPCSEIMCVMALRLLMLIASAINLLSG